ncbi:MAG: ABC transporter substrate-binding protein [Alphaproteobacteria bacterium]|nr:ABC transporter substrate-binding protein [Alphaproteobacteria bacterium]
MKRLLVTLCLLVLTVPSWAADKAKEPILIGEISEAKFWNVMAINQRRGFELALEDINGKGGALGRPLKMISRDGGDGSPEQVLRDVEELVSRQGVQLLTGTGPDNVSLAVSSYAKQHGIFYLKSINGTNKQIWEEGHDLAFRFDVPNYMFGGALAETAAKLPAKRWAFVAPDYEFGHSLVTEFQKALKQRRPDVEFVATQYHPTLKIDAGAVVSALKHANPDAIFVANFGNDAAQFIRQGKARGLFKNRPVVSVLLGQPEGGLDPLGKEAPVGWITIGYPLDEIEAPAHKEFLAKYRAKYNAEPGWFSFTGYNSIISLVKAIEKAGSTEPHAVAAAMKGMTFDSLIGPLTYRAADNQSNLGLWVGKIGLKDNKPALVDWTYKSGDKFYPGDSYVKTVRPQQK